MIIAIPTKFWLSSSGGRRALRNPRQVANPISDASALLQPQPHNASHRSLPSSNAHPRPIGWGEGRGEGQFLVSSRNCKAVTETLHYLPPGRCRLRQIVKITG